MTRPLPPRYLGAAAVALLVLCGAWYWFGRKPPAEAKPPPAIRVDMATVQRADVPVYLEGLGTVQAFYTVTVTARVDGQIDKVAFTEGQDVRKGTLLVQIDPRPYQAALGIAVATRAKDQALLANAQRDMERYTVLAPEDLASKQTVDTQRALIAQLIAQIKGDEAAIDNARTQLDYTSITSPIDGRTGIRLVDQGNVVHAATPTPIVIVTQIQPIALLFTLPQQQLGQINTAIAKANAAGTGALVVEALGADNKTVVDRGKLQVVNNQVDQTTGTIQLKAEFPNANLQLWPGQFVNVRLLIDTLRDVVVVPPVAVQRGPPPNTNFVYVIQQDNTVSVRAVAVGQQNESQAVITRGLNADDRVVTSGFTQLADKKPVAIAPAQAAEGAPAGDAAASPKASKSDNAEQKPARDKTGGRRRQKSDAGPSTP
jgi:multidrug efflux system membrane fusion protein